MDTTSSKEVQHTHTSSDVRDDELVLLKLIESKNEELGIKQKLARSNSSQSQPSNSNEEIDSFNHDNDHNKNELTDNQNTNLDSYYTNFTNSIERREDAIQNDNDEICPHNQIRAPALASPRANHKTSPTNLRWKTHSFGISKTKSKNGGVTTPNTKTSSTDDISHNTELSIADDESVRDETLNKNIEGIFRLNNDNMESNTDDDVSCNDMSYSNDSKNSIYSKLNSTVAHPFETAKLSFVPPSGSKPSFFTKKFANLRQRKPIQSSSNDTTTPNLGLHLNIPTTVKVEPSSPVKNVDKYETDDEAFTPKPYYLFPKGMLMTEKELYQDMIRPSEGFKKLISPTLPSSTIIGHLKTEVLCCIGLPKFDRFSKPDAVVYLICGDVPFATDIVHSSFSPIWPNRSKRSAIFPVYHAYARLFAGVFNAGDKENDDFIGRTVIDLSQLRPNCVYDVTLPLQTTSFVYNCRPRGLIRLRFSLTWVNQQATVLSYLPLRKYAYVDHLHIPCADQKTLRNVAFTAHGEELPGRYSRRAFKANAREAALYNLQLKYHAKRTIRNIRTYSNPFISLYIFIGWMSIAYFSSISYVLPFIISIIIILYLDSYKTYVKDATLVAGFSSLTLSEIILSLMFGSICENKATMKTIHKENKNFKMISDIKSFIEIADQEEPKDENHLEFPFSEKSKYKRIPASSRIAPKVRVSQVAPTVTNTKSDYQKSSSSFRGALKGLNNSTSTVYDSDEIEDDDDEQSVCDSVGSDNDGDSDIFEALFCDENLIPIGPEQNDDIPDPQKEMSAFKQNVECLEQNLHRLTANLFYDPFSTKKSPSNSKSVLRPKYGNPLLTVTANYLEPVMRVVRIYVLSVRAGFSIACWKDPYLSTWVLLYLILLMITLILFPYRLFFLSTGFIYVGPQNYIYYSFYKSKKTISMFNFVFGTTKVKENNNNEEIRKDIEFDKNLTLFSAQSSRLSSKTKNVCEEAVIIPYSRLRRERFFNWPPYPSVSSISPLTEEKQT